MFQKNPSMLTACRPNTNLPRFHAKTGSKLKSYLFIEKFHETCKKQKKLVVILCWGDFWTFQ
jgi:hypothetical protein